MSKTSLIIKSTSQEGKTQNKTITDINPACSNEVLATFGQKLNALTTNFYGETTRIDKTNCDLEGGGGKQTPTLTLSATTKTIAAVESDSDPANMFGITYNGNGLLRASITTGGSTGTTSNSRYAVQIVGNYVQIVKNSGATVPTQTLTIIVTADATETYKAASATLTLTA